MTIYILGLVLITVLSLVSLGFFLLNTNPNELTSQEMTIFYLSLFLSLFGIVTLLGISIRKKLSNFHLNWKMLRPALRQGLFSALVITGMFILAGFNLLNFQKVFLLILAGILMEFLCWLYDKRSYEKRA